MNTWFPYTKYIDNPHHAVLALPFVGGSAKQFKPLIDILAERSVMVYAVQLPGREKRKYEPYLASCEEVARNLFNLLKPKFNKCEWTILGHDVGAWIAYELYRLMDRSRVRLPKRMIISAFPPPTIEPKERPWKMYIDIGERGFKEQLARWEFPRLGSEVWPILRTRVIADSQLYENYIFS